MPSNEPRNPSHPGQTPGEGVTVIGEAVRRVSPENAEFLMEITNAAPSAAQAIRDNHHKTAQLAQAVAGMGVQPADLQTISFNVYSLFALVMQALSAYGAIPQIGHGAFPGYAGAASTPGMSQGDIQFGTYHARNTVRVNVREPGRAGEIVDALTKVGATIAGAFSFKPSEEAQARRAALEAAAQRRAAQSGGTRGSYRPADRRCRLHSRRSGGHQRNIRGVACFTAVQFRSGRAAICWGA